MHFSIHKNVSVFVFPMNRVLQILHKNYGRTLLEKTKTKGFSFNIFSYRVVYGKCIPQTTRRDTIKKSRKIISGAQGGNEFTDHNF